MFVQGKVPYYLHRVHILTFDGLQSEYSSSILVELYVWKGGEEGTNQGHKMSLLHSIGPIDDDDDQLLILLEN